MRIHTLIVLGALLAAAASLAAAQEAGSASFSASAVLTDSRVRMRGSPGLEGATLGFLNKGDHVTVVGVSDTADHIGDATDYWYHVTTADSKDGWVFGAFLSFDRSEAPAQQWQVILDAKVRHYGTRFLDVTANSGGSGPSAPLTEALTFRSPIPSR